MPGGKVLIANDEPDLLELSSIVSAQGLGGVRRGRQKTVGPEESLPYYLLPQSRPQSTPGFLGFLYFSPFGSLTAKAFFDVEVSDLYNLCSALG